jgi:hypothetical protein
LEGRHDEAVSARTAILCIGIASLCGLAAAAAAPPAPKKPAPAKRAELFVGNGTASWLPKAKILPSALDIETLAQKLSSRVRNMDPFGLPTFPRPEDMIVTRQLPEIARSTERVTLNQALQTLNVTGINLEKKEILFRGRNVFEGDVMAIAFKDQVFLAQVVEVNATQILFRDIKRQESGVLPHTLVPHLDLEPIQNRRSGLEGRLTPMETSNPRPQ